MWHRLPSYWLVLLLSFAAPAQGGQAPVAEAEERCARQLKVIGLALSAYRRERGNLPPHLSVLYSRYLPDRRLLHCPADRSRGTTRVSWIEPDPVPISYLYEMSLAGNPRGIRLGPAPGGKVSNWRDLKVAQRLHFGEAVPVVTCWHHLKQRCRLNLTLDGRIYRSGQAWEHEPAAVAAALSRLERDLTAGPSAFRRHWWPEALAWYAYPLAGLTSPKTQSRFRAAADRLSTLGGWNTDTDREVWTAAGSLYYAGGDVVKAAEAFETAIQRRGRHSATPYLFVAEIYRRAGDRQRARDRFQQMPPLTNYHIGWMSNLSYVYRHTSRLREAATWDQQASWGRSVIKARAKGRTRSLWWIGVLAFLTFSMLAAALIYFLAKQHTQRTAALQEIGLADSVSGFDLTSPVPAEPEVTQVRPWVRFWARYLDQLVWGMGVMGILSLVDPSLVEAETSRLIDRLEGMVLVLLWVFPETCLLSTWGTTPGKWFLKVRVRDSAGKKLKFSRALHRSFSVWWRGLAIGFPLAQFWSFTHAYDTLKREGVTSWDRDGGYVVLHERIGLWRILGPILLLLGALLLAIYLDPSG
jgi:tetratricopeptide (TPR) repeat protein/uncharacterized RDD family membrane protein YckC